MYSLFHCWLYVLGGKYNGRDIWHGGLDGLQSMGADQVPIHVIEPNIRSNSYEIVEYLQPISSVGNMPSWPSQFVEASVFGFQNAFVDLGVSSTDTGSSSMHSSGIPLQAHISSKRYIMWPVSQS